jgi:threonine synthase
VKPGEIVVLILTGSLLKDPDFTMDFHRGDIFQGTAHETESEKLKTFRHPPLVLDATLEAVTRALDQAEKSDRTHSNA